VPQRILGLLIVLALGLPAHLAAQQPDEPVYDQGNGVTMPKVITQVYAHYTANAMKKKLKGRIALKAVVTKAGIPTQIEVTEHLDDEMDAECVRALEQWRFEPGTKDGQPVAVRITVDMTFTVK
jgi:protein TonB